MSLVGKKSLLNCHLLNLTTPGQPAAGQGPRTPRIARKPTYVGWLWPSVLQLWPGEHDQNMLYKQEMMMMMMMMTMMMEIRSADIYIYIFLFFSPLRIGKYTFRPMDPSWFFLGNTCPTKTYLCDLRFSPLISALTLEDGIPGHHGDRFCPQDLGLLNS